MFEPGQKIGRYTLLGKIAAGGMAEVHLARQDGPEGFRKLVVVKCILPSLAADKNFVQMFLNEGRLAALLNHPNVVSIFELGQDAASGAYFIAMEWIDGANLKRVVHQAMGASGTTFPPRVAARIMADVAAGLEAAHNLKGDDGHPLNMVHRDISPDNILVTYGGVVKVVDFGIAKAAQGESLTAAGQVKGKFGYMAPELLLGKQIDRRIDIWAMGVTLYWMLCGSKPFSAENEGELVVKIMQEPPPLLGERAKVPPELVAITMRALEKSPEARYPTARAMQRDLLGWLQTTVQSLDDQTLSEFMDGLFPETTDPDRASVRAILSGRVRDSPNPSKTDVRAVDALTVSTGGLRLRRRWRLVAAGSTLAALVAVSGVWVAAQRSAAQKVSEPASAQAAAPAPATAQAPPAPVVAPVVPEPPPSAITEPLVPPPVGAIKESRATRDRVSTHRPGRVATAGPAVPSPLSAPAAAPAPIRAASSGPPGKLDLKVVPWAVAYLDGRKIGTTPFEPLEVPVGSHVLKLMNDELGATKELNVEIQSGKAATVRVKLP